jgi:hypothetical protein
MTSLPEPCVVSSQRPSCALYKITFCDSLRYATLTLIDVWKLLHIGLYSVRLRFRITMLHNVDVKDIVQPKMRGDERGTIRTVLTSYTIADIF